MDTDMIRARYAHLLIPALLAAAAMDKAHAAAPVPAPVKPGLWELSSKIASTDAATQSTLTQIQQQLANMDPQQRQALQQMLQKNGVQLDIGANGDLRTRMCVTREMAERRELPVQQGECTQQTTPLSATRVKVSFACTRPRASGEGEVTMDSDTRYRARMHVKSDERNQSANMDVSGQWLSADCGNVRPVSIPRAQ
jgi:hypothetical protein